MSTFSFSPRTRKGRSAPSSNSGYACPQCDSRTLVTDSRQDISGHVRRRRRCNGCGLRFFTSEALTSADLPNVDNQRLKLFNKVFPLLQQVGDLIDQMQAEHEP